MSKAFVSCCSRPLRRERASFRLTRESFIGSRNVSSAASWNSSCCRVLLGGCTSEAEGFDVSRRHPERPAVKPLDTIKSLHCRLTHLAALVSPAVDESRAEGVERSSLGGIYDGQRRCPGEHGEVLAVRLRCLPDERLLGNGDCV